MTAPDARDELREMAEVLYPGLFPADAIRLHSKQIERVTAYADSLARVRAAEELESWARSFRRIGEMGLRRENRRVFPQVADVLDAGAQDLRDALAADDQPNAPAE